MLDNLRNQASFQEDEPVETPEVKPPKQKKPRRGLDKMTGMTAPQRFALALMLFFIVCLFGTLLLFISGKVLLPF
jgi:hypothetical protein